MTMLLRALVLRPMGRDPLRTALTLVGVAVGVAVVVAIQLANQSALRAFRDSVDAVAGRANYQIVPDAGLLDEMLLTRLRPFWQQGVRFAPVIDVDGIVDPGETPIRLLAVDLLSDLHFRDYRYARIAVGSSRAGTSQDRYLDLFRDDSVILPDPFAREHHWTLGSPMTISILGARRTMVVRGILEARGPATAFNGSIAVCDIAAAQASFGLTGKLSRIDLLIPPESENAIVRAIRRALPPATRIERPSRRNERVERMLRAFRVNLFALAGVALLVGMFLVYNTMLISILRRRRDVGIVKTIGASPDQIFVTFLAEALVFGVAGSAAGILLGRGLAFAILRVVGSTVNSLYVASEPEAVTLTAGVIAAGFAVGLILSLVSAIHPASEAARFAPNALLRIGLHQQVPPPNRRKLAILATLSFAVAAIISRVPPVAGIAVGGYVAVVFVVAGFSFLTPMILTGVSRFFSPFLSRFSGVTGHLASRSLMMSLRRTSIASASLSVAIGMMVAVAVMVGSFRETVRIWVGQTVRSDLWLRPSRGLSNAQAAFFAPSILADLRRFDFIAAIDPIRGQDIVYEDAIVSVGSGDFRVAADRGDLPMIAPRSGRQALADAVRRSGVVVSETFALKYRKRVGDVVTLPVAHGFRTFPVTGIYRDYSNDRGVVVMDRALYIDSFADEAINTVVVFLRPGVRMDDARRRLESALGPKYHAFTVTNGEIRREVMRIFDQTFSVTWALLGVAIIVAVLGIINTLSALILERTRELALLRVGGLSHLQIRTMLVIESSLLGIASTAAGTVMGYILSLILIYVINKQSFGWTIEFHSPVALIVASLLTTFAAAAVAGLVPGRLASRIRLAEALKVE